MFFAETTVHVTSLDHTTFTDQVFHIAATWNSDDDNLVITGVATVQDCYRICYVTNGEHCSMFSYNETTDTCHVPHDSVETRDTMLYMNGIEQEGFISYFMKTETIPAFSRDHSGTGVVYWRDTQDDLAENVRLMGIDSLDECHVACQLSNSGKCWVFRYNI
jgi:hypothetical protein